VAGVVTVAREGSSSGVLECKRPCRRQLATAVAGVETVAREASSRGVLVSWSPASRPRPPRQATAADLGRGVEEGEQPRQFLGACIEAAANPGEGGESLSRSCDYWLPESRPRRRKRAAGPPLRFSAASVETAASEVGSSSWPGSLRRDRCEGIRPPLLFSAAIYKMSTRIEPIGRFSELAICYMNVLNVVVECF
jgi:hypothetical protein